MILYKIRFLKNANISKTAQDKSQNIKYEFFWAVAVLWFVHLRSGAELEQPQKGLLYVMLSAGAGRNIKIVEYLVLLLVLQRLDFLILKKKSHVFFHSEDIQN